MKKKKVFLKFSAHWGPAFGFKIFIKVMHLMWYLSSICEPYKFEFLLVEWRISCLYTLERCCEVGPWRPHKLRLFGPLLTPLFHEHSHRVFGLLLYAILQSCDSEFAGQVVYKPWVVSVSSEVLMPITAILISATDCVHLLHQLVIGPVTAHLM